MEVGDRDFGMEDAESDIVPGVFSFDPYPVCRSCGDEGPGPTFSPVLFYIGDEPKEI